MGPKILVNVNTKVDLGKVADAVAKKTHAEGSISVINSNSTPERKGVIIEFYESEGGVPEAIETTFRVER